MPIRMEQDPERKQPRRNNIPSNNRGGGGLGQLLPFLLPLLLKNRKLLLIAIIAGGIWFFFLGGSESLFGNLEGGHAGGEEFVEQFTFGAALSEEEYYKANVYEPLASTPVLGNTRLPAQVSLLEYAPKRMHQGRQGSCVGWASSYAARTILQSRATGQRPDNVAF